MTGQDEIARFRELRRYSGMSLEDIADELGVGIEAARRWDRELSKHRDESSPGEPGESLAPAKEKKEQRTSSPSEPQRSTGGRHMRSPRRGSSLLHSSDNAACGFGAQGTAEQRKGLSGVGVFLFFVGLWVVPGIVLFFLGGFLSVAFCDGGPLPPAAKLLLASVWFGWLVAAGMTTLRILSAGSKPKE